MLENLAPSMTAPYLKQNLLETGNTYCVDRDYRLTAVSGVLQDGVWIQTVQADAANGSDGYRSFDIAQSIELEIGYDSAASGTPARMDGFTGTGWSVGTENPKAPSMRVYRDLFPAGSVGLGGNMAAGLPTAAATAGCGPRHLKPSASRR